MAARILFVLLLATFSYVQSEEISTEQSSESDDMTIEEMQNAKVPPPLELEGVSNALQKAVKRKELIEEKAGRVPFLLLPHKPNYLMPITHQERPFNAPFESFVGDDEWPGLSQQEAVFQLSFKYRITDLPGNKRNKLYVAYTNKSWWQVYNSDTSRPFRETNHEPEIMAVFNPKISFISRAYISLNHQSNGQYTEFSRSWNRLIFGAFHITGNMVVGVTPWWRLPETNSADPDDPSDNDNPDIDDYMGYGEFIFVKMIGPRYFSMRLRNNLRTKNNYGAVEMEWNFPITSRVKGFVQYFEGYGESLIEYDHYQKRIGFGFKVSDYL